MDEVSPVTMKKFHSKCFDEMQNASEMLFLRVFFFKNKTSTRIKRFKKINLSSFISSHNIRSG
jgi:hypothetical protein